MPFCHGISTRVAKKKYAVDPTATIVPVVRSPRKRDQTPRSATASARSSLQSTVSTAATQNSGQRFARAAQYAKSSGPMATASG